MKNILLLSFIILCVHLNAQDTIVYKSGETKAVQILKLKKESNLIVYTLGKDTIYSSFKNIERFTMHSKINNESMEITSSGTDNISPQRVYRKKEVNVKTYEYGAFSISTNLAALLNLSRVSSRLTIEPEYRLNDNFSLKAPIYLRVFNQTKNVDRRIHSYDGSFTDYASPPEMDEYYGNNPEEILIQVGINPKYYPFGKSDRLFALYVSGALNFGIASNFESEVYVDYYTVSEWGTTRWKNNQSFNLIDGAFNYFNYEGVIGMDINFSKRITATFETGYSSMLFGEQNNHSRVYRKTPNTEYELIYEGEPYYLSTHHNFLKARLLLTYHF